MVLSLGLGFVCQPIPKGNLEIFRKTVNFLFLFDLKEVYMEISQAVSLIKCRELWKDRVNLSFHDTF